MKNLLTLFAVLGLVGLFSACSSDDTPPVAPAKYEGIYKGNLNVNMEGQDLGSQIQKIEIIKQADNVATLQLKNFKFGPLVIGDIIVNQAIVASKDKLISLVGQENLKLEVGYCDVTVDATVDKEVLSAKITVLLDLPDANGNPTGNIQTIIVTFKGNRTMVQESTEAKLLTFGLKDLETTSVIEGDKVTLTVDKADEFKLIKAMAVATISENATINPSLDVEQDFSEPVEYTVTAEDGISKTIYTIATQVNMTIGSVVAFDLSIAELTNHGLEQNIPKILSALPKNTPPFIWSSGDQGAVFTVAMGKTDRFGVTHFENDDEFGAPVFRIETLDTQGEGMIPKITSGSMFLGTFKINIFDTLKSTRFGVPVDKQPFVVSGTVSYKSGKDYFHCPDIKIAGTANHVPGKEDKGIVSAVVFEVENESDALDGTNLYTSDKIIGIGKLTFEDGFKDDFEIEIKYTKQFDSTKKYKLALVLSASENGDKFSGAGGSVLKVSKLEVGFE